jgi:hypothetical protein
MPNGAAWKKTIGSCIPYRQWHRPIGHGIRKEELIYRPHHKAVTTTLHCYFELGTLKLIYSMFFAVELGCWY